MFIIRYEIISNDNILTNVTDFLGIFVKFINFKKEKLFYNLKNFIRKMYFLLNNSKLM